MKERLAETQAYFGAGAMLYTYYNHEKIDHKSYDEDTIIKQSKFTML